MEGGDVARFAKGMRIWPLPGGPYQILCRSRGAIPALCRCSCHLRDLGLHDSGAGANKQLLSTRYGGLWMKFREIITQMSRSAGNKEKSRGCRSLLRVLPCG